ncbi:class I SAM-dependent methyltransferase [Azohydromonas caseinilytica]|uniref:Class I SAM-dependent methyltransferase n=1 Tax=Azohydromonas caseinilytica TaxID=2728836 RepID=A0A848FFC8_9BURK|nr:class I SAM-dependent methyltransferase [Azohydromonas caseinilytica]NML17029.1 class I SAM-dependent methyltransferase [Azohydromonas caseinilytica]
MPLSPYWYDRYLLPRLLDCACGLAPIARQRRKVIPQAAGRVLEIGIGTGLNLTFYDRSKVEKVVGVDPAAEMHPLARKRSQQLGLPVELLQLSAEELPAESGSFDTVTCTYSLCSITNPSKALREMRRVLKPGGKLLFAEHGLAPDEPVARWQRRLEPYWSRIAGGCHLTRDIPRLLAEAGFSANMEAGYVAWPKSLAYNFVGTATAAT